MMTFPTEWKNKSYVPNHQPDIELKPLVQPGDFGIPPFKKPTSGKSNLIPKTLKHGLCMVDLPINGIARPQ